VCSEVFFTKKTFQLANEFAIITLLSFVKSEQSACLDRSKTIIIMTASFSGYLVMIADSLCEGQSTLKETYPRLYEYVQGLATPPDEWTTTEAIYRCLQKHGTSPSDQYDGFARTNFFLRDLSVRIRCYLHNRGYRPIGTDDAPFCICVCTLTKKLLGPFACTDLVSDIPEYIERTEGIPPDQIRIVFKGKYLDPDSSLTSHGIEKNVITILHMRLQLRGMISTFSSVASSSQQSASDASLAKFLFGDANELADDLYHDESVDVSIRRLLRQKELASYADRDGSFDAWYDNGVLGADTLDIFARFVEHVWKRQKNESQNQQTKDMRMVISAESLVYILEQCVLTIDRRYAQTLVQTLQKLHTGRKNGSTKLAFRRTEGPTQACINFHCDGPYATSTVQIALNDENEYSGGRLLFYNSAKGLYIPRRSKGSMTRHKPNILHAVTPVFEGVRKSLFVVDQSNGLGEKEVYHIGGDDIHTFVRKYTSRKETTRKKRNRHEEEEENAQTSNSCIICYNRPASVAIVPCGHLCFCGPCSDLVYSKCPVCRRETETTITIYHCT
jgi:hypothetical protein